MILTLSDLPFPANRIAALSVTGNRYSTGFHVLGCIAAHSEPDTPIDSRSLDQIDCSDCLDAALGSVAGWYGAAPLDHTDVHQAWLVLRELNAPIPDTASAAHIELRKLRHQFAATRTIASHPGCVDVARVLDEQLRIRYDNLREVLRTPEAAAEVRRWCEVELDEFGYADTDVRAALIADPDLDPGAVEVLSSFDRRPDRRYLVALPRYRVPHAVEQADRGPAPGEPLDVIADRVVAATWVRHIRTHDFVADVNSTEAILLAIMHSEYGLTLQMVAFDAAEAEAAATAAAIWEPGSGGPLGDLRECFAVALAI